MANETTTRGPLTATVGERLGEKAREGDTAGVEAAQQAVEDLRRAAYDEEGRESSAAAGRTSPRWSGRSRGDARGSGVGWALAAGLGTFAVVGLVRRAFGR